MQQVSPISALQHILPRYVGIFCIPQWEATRDTTNLTLNRSPLASHSVPHCPETGYCSPTGNAHRHLLASAPLL